MGLITAIGTILKRQQESGGDKLLDLLEDPFGDQVSPDLATVLFAGISNTRVARTKFRLRQFGNIRWLHVSSCPQFLPPTTL